MDRRLKVLIVEDNPADARFVRLLLTEGGGDAQFDLQQTDRLSTALESINGSQPDVILLDLSLPDSKGMDTVIQMLKRAPGTPIIILTGLDDEVLAIQSIHQGAQDYLSKNRLDEHLLTRAIWHAIERKQGEERLRQSEERYRLLFDNNPLPMWVYDIQNYRFLSVNQAVIDHYGYSRDEFMAMTILDIRPAEELERLRENLLQQSEVVQKSSPWKHRKKDGTLMDVEIISHDFTFQDQPARLVLANDITQRLRAELALQESEARYRAVFENSLDAILMTSPDGTIHYANQSACEMFGSTQDDLRKIGRQGVVNAADPRLPVLLEERRRTGRLRGDLTFIRSDGAKFDGEITSEIFLDKNGLEKTSMIIRDITERKRAEEKNRQQIERLTALREIDQAIVSNSDLNHSLTILISRAVTLLNVDAATVLLLQPDTNTLDYGAGYGFRTTAPETASVKLGESYAGQAAMEKQLVQIPNLAEEPDNFFLTGFLKGEDFVSYYGVPLIVKGEVVGVLEAFNRSLIERDQDWLDFFITLAGQAAIAIANAQLFLKLRSELQERLRTEEQIRELNLKLEQRVAERTIELERALKVKDEFLANMSHELRTPLNAILGLTESMQEGTTGGVNEKQFKYLNIIHESGRHLLNLINDILDLAKIESGQVILDIVKVDIQLICQASLRMIQQLAYQKNQEVSFVMDKEIGLIWADQRRLKQMVVNLLSNAVKFTPDGGKLGLEVTANRQEHTVSIAVWDHGVGISESDLGRLFQPFVQVNSALSRNGSGTGLGLTLVAQMARSHGGHVRAKSAPGQGSRFTIILPWNPADRTGSLGPANPSASSSNLPMQGNPSHTILLAEDTTSAAMMMEDYLTAAGFNVMIAGNGLEAISQAETIRPDLILMDVMMPDMDGFEATRIIRKNPALQKTPILGLTALAMPGDRERCLEAGMNDHITKPVNLMELLHTIRGYLPR